MRHRVDRSISCESFIEREISHSASETSCGEHSIISLFRATDGYGGINSIQKALASNLSLATGRPH
jgi:hypothetical protein